MRKIVKSKMFSAIYFLCAVSTLIYFKDYDSKFTSKLVLYWVMFSLAIRVIADKKWLQLGILALILVLLNVYLF
ncbi:hypothetical protein [Clostridium intestinale]|uniref:hypothetical protein n=1 Tax=Clostridium intestinale TaxID=36845 RepID=UPI002DD69A23|nr:hypothetical protein [Clostridium intestinale]WRY53274.1 hypothetical protein P8F83_08715 [Clostridium intestinale]